MTNPVDFAEVLQRAELAEKELVEERVANANLRESLKDALKEMGELALNSDECSKSMCRVRTLESELERVSEDVQPLVEALQECVCAPLEKIDFSMATKALAHAREKGWCK